MPAFTTGVVSIKLISLIISGRYSRAAGAKILDYYKSVITGSVRSSAPSLAASAWSFTIVNEAHRHVFAPRFSVARARARTDMKHHRLEVGYGNKPRTSAPGALVIADL